MRVLMLSLDGKILENNSAVRQRIIVLAEKSGEITVFVPAKKDERQEVSPYLKIHGFSGGKIVQLWKMWRERKQILSQTQPPKAAPFIKGDTTTSQPLLGKKGRKNYDLITVQDIYFLGFLAVKLAQKFSLLLEVQVHGFEKMWGIRRIIAGFVLRRADRIRVVSERLKKQLTTNYPACQSAGRHLPTNKLYTLPVYTQIEKNMEYRIPNREKAQFTFLTVGRLVPVKNIALQIRAFARVVKEFPNTRLVVVGDGPLLRNVQFSISNFQLQGKVIVEGQQKDLSRFYREADAFLLTSDYEGWGVAVTEAAAYRLPVIMTDVGLAGEFIRDGENGLVIPVGDEDALVSAMTRLMSDAALRARLGEAARAAFQTLPSPEEQIRKQIAEWRGLANMDNGNPT